MVLKDTAKTPGTGPAEKLRHDGLRAGNQGRDYGAKRVPGFGPGLALRENQIRYGTLSSTLGSSRCNQTFRRMRICWTELPRAEVGPDLHLT